MGMAGSYTGLDTAETVPTKRPARLADYVPECVFCQIVAGEAPAKVVNEDGFSLTIVPLNPVVGGHTITIPKLHVPDALSAPGVTGALMASACEAAAWRYGPCNIITSVGVEATQSVFHLHIHVVPRAHNDGLRLPWTAQHTDRNGSGGI